MAHPTPKLRRFAIALQFQPFAVQSGLKYSLVFLTGPTTTIVSADPKEKLQRRSYHPIQKKSRSRRPRLTNLILAPHVSPRIRARRELGLNLLRKLVRVLFLPLLRARSGNIWLSRVSGTARRGRRDPAVSFGTSLLLLLLKMPVQYLRYTIKSRLIDSNRGAKVSQSLKSSFFISSSIAKERASIPEKMPALVVDVSLLSLLISSGPADGAKLMVWTLLFAGPSAEGSPR